jgi:FtsH-binding integral membrane protein
MVFNKQTTAAKSSVSEAILDQGLRAYMLKVYNYMSSGVLLTGFIALLFFKLSVVTGTSGEILGLTSFGNAVYASALQWVFMLAPLGIVFYMSFNIAKMTAAKAQTTFWVFAALMGASLSSIFLVYTGTSITRVFFITSATFGAMSIYGYTTNRDLTKFGSFLMMGLIGIIIASIVNIFLKSSMMYFVISILGVLIFVGLTAYDTQKIKNMYLESDSGEVVGKKAVMGALTLYLDFINLFIMLLRLLVKEDNYFTERKLFHLTFSIKLKRLLDFSRINPFLSFI